MEEDAAGGPTGSPKVDYQLPNERGSGSDSVGSPSYESPCPPYFQCGKKQRIEPINPDYNPVNEIEMPCQTNRQQLFIEDETTAVVMSEQVPEEQIVKRTGKRKKNKLHDGIQRVTAITKSGKPIAPKGILAMWRNDCGVIVRQYGKIIWDNWLKVDRKEKESLWSRIRDKYIFPDEFLEKVKNATLKTMGKCLRTFRHNLDKLYIKQGRTPFMEYGFITPDEWKIFVEQRTSEEALAHSKAFQDLNQMNKFPHHLGPGGYEVQIPKWREEEKKEREAGIPDSYEGCNDRIRNWAKARLKKSSDGKSVARSSAVNEVVQKAKVINVEVAEGKVQLNPPNDQLTIALGNMEHRGRTRAIDSMAPWSQGFFEDAGCSTDKEDTEFKTWSKFFWKFYHENQNLTQRIEVPEFRLTVDNEQQPCTQRFAPCNTSSTSVDSIRYPVDRIKEDTPCSLLLPIGTKGRTKMVAEGIAMVGRVMHTRAIPAECARVQVLRVIDDKFSTDELDYPNQDEGIETLGDAVNNIILWPRKDIVIDTPSRIALAQEEEGADRVQPGLDLAPALHVQEEDANGARAQNTPPQSRVN